MTTIDTTLTDYGFYQTTHDDERVVFMKWGQLYTCHDLIGLDRVQ